ncbi:MAG: sigma-70 family RNA polymerase sigma factor [Erythrobacter sp.]|nr:sigma-70 family RNA polymerase sigma factor [Erythrobacter sp.]NCQ62879.1 sigma-70 family RNA polymerase sigma factor [Alphaproteobacteria bacterium]
MQESSPEARDRLKRAMDRLAAGDRGALEVVYRLTNVKLFGICCRILGDRKEAEDALQDVYITLWRNASRYDASRASPIAWLATFARNRAVDRLRTGKVRRGAVPVDEAAQLADGSAPADAMMIDAERTARVHSCLETLDPKQGGPIRTAFLEGQTYAELAERDGVPLGTMKSWIRRGLAKLRDCMERGE